MLGPIGDWQQNASMCWWRSLFYLTQLLAHTSQRRRIDRAGRTAQGIGVDYRAAIAAYAFDAKGVGRAHGGDDGLVHAPVNRPATQGRAA